MRMRYIIIMPEQVWYDAEKFTHGMTVIDLAKDLYTTDGKKWEHTPLQC